MEPEGNLRLHGPRSPQGARSAVRIELGAVFTAALRSDSSLLVPSGSAARLQLGQVASLLQGVPPKTTPLQQRLAAFGRRLSYAVLAICLLVFAIGVLRGEPVLLMGLTAVSLGGGRDPRGAAGGGDATAGLLIFSVGLVIFELKKIELADYLPSLAVAPLLTWLLRLI